MQMFRYLFLAMQKLLLGPSFWFEGDDQEKQDLCDWSYL